MSGHLIEIRSDDPVRWNALLDQAGEHDFYHSCEYHRLAETRAEGSARLLCWTDRGETIVLPLMIRDLPANLTVAPPGNRWCDVTSVYGYAGPIGECAPSWLIDGFAGAVSAWCRDNQVISAFSRLHPLFDSSQLIAGLGEVVAHGRTVSIDLGQTADDRRARYRTNHRRDLRKLREKGVACHLSHGEDAVASFAEIYQETMSRVSAARSYRFDSAYFKQLLAIDGLVLMLCTINDEACAGAILSFRGRIAQYHLGGTRNAWLGAAPMKLVFDEACEAASAHGCSRLHLGGGLGASEDALFTFKAGFSPDRHVFRTWRWVIDNGTYAELAKMRGNCAANGVFPVYRS